MFVSTGLGLVVCIWPYDLEQLNANYELIEGDGIVRAVGVELDSEELRRRGPSPTFFIGQWL